MPKNDTRPHSTHVAIVGGGVAGCSLAYELSRYPLKVTLLEAGQIARQGASSVPVALLNPHRGRTARSSALDLAGLEAMRQVAHDLEREGLPSGIRFPGVLRIASNEKQAKKWRGLTGVRWLEASEVPPSYHAPFGALKVERGGWLEPAVYLASLAESAGRRGVTVLEGCQVKAIETSESAFVLFTPEDRLEVDRVVLCIGANQPPDLDEPLPDLERLAGDVIGLDVGDTVTYPIAGAVYGAQKGATMFVGGNHRPQGEPDPNAVSRLQTSASWFVKALKDAPVSSHWTGVRAKREDNQPLVLELVPNLWVYGALAGRGFLCSGYLSRQLARQLL